MNIVLLSGGSGKRLWPLSNEVRSKQFLKLFRREDGSRESMVQRMCRMIRETDPEAGITIAAPENQVAYIRDQLGDSVAVSVEPCRRDTFPAIALAVSCLHDEQGVDERDPVVVCPVDPYVDQDYFRKLSVLSALAEKGDSRLVLMGIDPDSPSEKYGYILPETQDPVSRVKTFREKPDRETAARYIRDGALWNSGVFAFQLRYVLEIAKKKLGGAGHQWLLDHYAELDRISFDYAVVEKEPDIRVMRFSGLWKDLGTWNTLTEAMSDESTGNAVAVGCHHTHIINELSLPLIALGVSDLAIAATPDGILVAAKDRSDELKNYVADQRPMAEKRGWGEYQVLDYRIQEDGRNFLTKRLLLLPGHHISYQRHRHRSEVWTVVEGTGRLILNGTVRSAQRGDTVCIRPGDKHAVLADTALYLIEVQVGDELTEEDIERLDWDWASME